MGQSGSEEPFGQFFHGPRTERIVRATDELERLIGTNAAPPYRRIRTVPNRVARPLRPARRIGFEAGFPAPHLPRRRAGTLRHSP